MSFSKNIFSRVRRNFAKIKCTNAVFSFFCPSNLNVID